ncbi:hypothetical protein BGZ60DRAFT_526439 [Tricladium varicosporioides]|nr:hypothetical protein BGZ60DRAFT_526439 [Hymenoscyphus varicosporioides]
MLLNTLLLLSISNVVSLVTAATTSGSATKTSTAPATTYTISVGKNGHNFTPNEINATVGDIIEYRFWPQNHSVVRGGFGDSPCVPYDLTSEGAGKDNLTFFSGFHPMDDLKNQSTTTFSIRINNTEPISFYCSAPSACLDGMIGVINPNATQNYLSQFKYTQGDIIQLSPGEKYPPETAIASYHRTGKASATANLVTVTAFASAAITTPASTSTAAAPAPASHSHISTGAIIGIAIGGVAVAVLAGALIWMCGRQKTIKEILHQQEQKQAQNHNSYQPASPGFSEAQFSMNKAPLVDGHSVSPGQGYGPDAASYRSMSPPPMDERAQMLGMVPATHHYNGHSNATSPGFPSPTYSHEMDHSHAVVSPGIVSAGAYAAVPPPPTFHPQPYDPNPNGPHEMEGNTLNNMNRAPSTGNPPPFRQEMTERPFSYTDSESGYGTRRDEKGSKR